MVARGLQELDDPTLFVRGEKQPVRYFMNENGAENAALHDLTKALMAVMAPSSSSATSWSFTNPSSSSSTLATTSQMAVA